MNDSASWWRAGRSLVSPGARERASPRRRPPRSMSLVSPSTTTPNTRVESRSRESQATQLPPTPMRRSVSTFRADRIRRHLARRSTAGLLVRPQCAAHNVTMRRAAPAVVLLVVIGAACGDPSVPQGVADQTGEQPFVSTTVPTTSPPTTVPTTCRPDRADDDRAAHDRADDDRATTTTRCPSRRCIGPRRSVRALW